MTELAVPFRLNDLRECRRSGRKVAMLTCYDFTTAQMMQRAGVQMLLVGDSAANVILGHDSTIPVPLDFMIELTKAVRRGAPNAFVVADMPFGTYGGDLKAAFENVVQMMKLSGADCVKMEVGATHVALIRELSANGVPVMAHIGLKPQSVGLIGGYKSQARTSESAMEMLKLAIELERAGAVALLIEAVPPEVSHRIVEHSTIPVIGCGAGGACHGHVVVMHDAVGFTEHPPRFVPKLGDIAPAMLEMFSKYVRMIESGAYPAAEHQYSMPEPERRKFATEL